MLQIDVLLRYLTGIADTCPRNFGIGFSQQINLNDRQACDWMLTSLAIMAYCLALCRRAPAMQVYGYCIIKNGQEAKIKYPKDGVVGEVSGRSFHNGRFVQKLRQAASQLANVTVRQAIVKRLLNGNKFDTDLPARKELATPHFHHVFSAFLKSLRSAAYGEGGSLLCEI